MHSSFISQILDLALKSGAEAAEVFQSDALSRLVFFETNRLKQLERSQSSGIALRLWRNGAPGLAVAHGPVDAERLVEKAIALSQLNEPETIELGQGTAMAYPDVPHRALGLGTQQWFTNDGLSQTDWQQLWQQLA